MEAFTLLAWQIQALVITCITLLLLAVALDDEAGSNLLNFFNGLKKLAIVKPADILDRLFALLKSFFGRDRHDE